MDLGVTLGRYAPSGLVDSKIHIHLSAKKAVDLFCIFATEEGKTLWGRNVLLH